MGKWSQELFADTDGQCSGMLKNVHNQHCCLGILEERTLHMDFFPIEGDMAGRMEDELHASGYVSHAVAEETGLANHVSSDELDKIRSVINEASKVDFTLYLNETRYYILGILNDNGVSFHTIATLIILLGWDVDDDPGFMYRLKNKEGVA